MPAYPPVRHGSSHHGLEPQQRDPDQISHVDVSVEAEDTIADLHQTITIEDPVFSDLKKYLNDDQGSRPQPFPLSVCFKSVSTYGRPGGAAPVKTLKDAIWRTLTFQDVYEWTFKKLISPDKIENGQALIRDFSGVVRNGEMMLWVPPF